MVYKHFEIAVEIIRNNSFFSFVAEIRREEDQRVVHNFTDAMLFDSEDAARAFASDKARRWIDLRPPGGN
jgi:hypothetical protein